MGRETRQGEAGERAAQKSRPDAESEFGRLLAAAKSYEPSVLMKALTAPWTCPHSLLLVVFSIFSYTANSSSTTGHVSDQMAHQII
jgi:hypothetical protein